MPLLQEPITKEQFEQELLNLPPMEADSRREFWTLGEALQAMENTKCPPPHWFIESFKTVLEHPSEERAAPWRELRLRPAPGMIPEMRLDLFGLRPHRCNQLES